MIGWQDLKKHACQLTTVLLSAKDSHMIHKQIMTRINGICITRFESPWELIKHIENIKGVSLWESAAPKVRGQW